MLIVNQKRKLLFIPEEFELELTEEIMEHYAIAATEQSIICLDTHIVRQMTFQFLRVNYYYEFGSIIEDDMLEDPEEWRFLNERYPPETRIQEIADFRKDVRLILMERQMVFEENWIYGVLPEQEYIFKIHNSPIQEVW